MGLREFFEFWKGKKEANPDELLTGLHDAMRESRIDDIMLKKLIALMKYLRKRTNLKIEFKGRFLALSKESEPFEGFRRLMGEFSKLRIEVIKYEKKEESVEGVFNVRIRPRVRAIRKEFESFQALLKENSDFFDRVAGYGKATDSVLVLKRKISESDSLLDSFDDTMKEFVSLLEAEHRLIGDLIESYADMEKRKRTLSGKGKLQSARHQDDELKQMISGKFREFGGLLEKQANLIDLLEGKINKMLELFSLIYKLFFSIDYSLQYSLKLSRTLGFLYHPSIEIGPSLRDKNMVKRFRNDLAKRLIGNDKFIQLKNEVQKEKDITDPDRVLVGIVNMILEMPIKGSALFSKIIELENYYADKNMHHNYITKPLLKKHYADFLNKSSEEAVIGSLTYREGIAIFFFLTYPPNVRYFTTPGIIISEKTSVIKGRKVNYPFFALKFYCEGIDEEAEEEIRYAA